MVAAWRAIHDRGFQVRELYIASHSRAPKPFKRLGWSSAKKVLLPLAVFSILSLLVMGPAFTDCTTTMVGHPGDATSGGVWTGWQYEALDSGPWPQRTPYLSAPFGERLWRPLSITQQAIFLPYWFLVQVTSPVCGWNVLVFLGFLATGLTMFYFVLWLTRSRWPAFIAGIAYAFSPYHMVKARDHISYLHSELLVALLWACFVLWRKPRMRTAVLTGIVIGLLPYTDGYYILMGAALFGGFVLFSLAHGVASPSVTRKELIQRVRAYLAAGAVALLVSMPIALMFFLQNSEIESGLQRGVGELEYYAGRPLQYLLPPREHPVFSGIFGEYQDRNVRANFSEETLSLGWTTIALAGVALFVVLKDKRVVLSRIRSGLDGTHLVLTLAGLTLLGLILSAPPSLHFLGFRTKGPSYFIFQLAPLWRVFARFFLMVHTALVPLAAVGAAILFGGRRWSRWAYPVLLCLVVFESLTFPPREDWSYSEAPREYAWLAQQESIDTVAEYPLLLPPANEAFGYLSWQVIHKKRLFNGSKSQDPVQPLRSAAFGLEDNQTSGLLNRLGIQLVLFHPQLQAGSPSTPPHGFELVRTFGKTMALRPRGAPAEVAVGPEQGFHPPEPMGWRSKHWMARPVGTLQLVDFGEKDDVATIAFRAESNGPPRELKITQGSKRLWQGMVATTDVRFEASVGIPIRLEISPGPSKPKGDERSLGISLSDLRVVIP